MWPILVHWLRFRQLYTFTIQNDGSMMNVSEQSGPQMGDGHRLRILLVDDVQENLELLEDVLSENGYVPMHGEERRRGAGAAAQESRST